MATYTILDTIFGCISCNRAVQEGIFNGDFWVIALKMLLPFGGVTVLAWSYHSSRSPDAAAGAAAGLAREHIRPVAVCALLIGIGMGGFVDGILLHQILQWHQMISNTLPPDNLEAKNINMFWDGIFHAFTWTVTMSGIVLLWRVAKRQDLYLSDYTFVGGLVGGWGTFNLIDSVFNHYIFRFHNVRENVANPEHWNLGFLLLSLLMMGIGYAVMRQAGKRPRT